MPEPEPLRVNGLELLIKASPALEYLCIKGVDHSLASIDLRNVEFSPFGSLLDPATKFSRLICLKLSGFVAHGY